MAPTCGAVDVLTPLVRLMIMLVVMRLRHRGRFASFAL